MAQSFKVIFVGKSSVGKTSIINRFNKDEFDPYQPPSFASSSIPRYVDIEKTGSRVKLQIWDTAGQEKYQSLASIFYREAAAAICVIDFTSAESLKECANWYEKVK